MIQLQLESYLKGDKLDDLPPKPKQKFRVEKVKQS